MAQLYTYFVFSDVHGEYDALIQSLQEAGYNPDNPAHRLISLGDNFDRGANSKKVWNYLRNHNAICVKGNHDLMFQEYLEKGMDGEFVLFNILHNGLGATIRSFSGMDMDTFKVSSLEQARTYINREAVLNWMRRLPLYYETEHFIFCHAGINPMLDDWRATDEHYMLWDIEDSHKPCNNTIKYVVIGHHHAFRVRENGMKAGYGDEDITKVRYHNGTTSPKFTYTGNTDEHRPYICQNKIAIDGCTNYTGKVNVLVIQDYDPAELKADAEKADKIIREESSKISVSQDGIITATWNPETTIYQTTFNN